MTVLDENGLTPKDEIRIRPDPVVGDVYFYYMVGKAESRYSYPSAADAYAAARQPQAKDRKSGLLTPNPTSRT